LLPALNNQQVRSIPGKQYVQQLYTGGATQGAAVRSSTIDWMVDTAQQLKLSSDSLFLAVQLLDRFLSAVLQECIDAAAAQAFMQSSKLQLSAITALWVAAKFEESCVPGASTFLQHLPGASRDNCHMLRQQLLEAEQVLLMTVDHRLAAPTPKTFLRRYLARVAVTRSVYFAAGYVAELALLDSGMLCFLPSMVAVSAYVWGLMLTGIECNDEHLQQLSGGWLKLCHILRAVVMAVLHSA
jgi:cyclin A